ncbi:MAG: AzlD domain-containing protein, partial [Clostridiales bacterium]|nr:AzlD domain-containing protein [Clostridiales bacterium]
MTKTLLSILTAAVVTYLVRVLPLTLIRKPIRSRFLRSFLYYVPYVTLAVMTFPAIVQATEQPVAGAAALVAGILIAWRGGGLNRELLTQLLSRAGRLAEEKGNGYLLEL